MASPRSDTSDEELLVPTTPSNDDAERDEIKNEIKSTTQAIKDVTEMQRAILNKDYARVMRIILSANIKLIDTVQYHKIIIQAHPLFKYEKTENIIRSLDRSSSQLYACNFRAEAALRAKGCYIEPELSTAKNLYSAIAERYTEAGYPSLSGQNDDDDGYVSEGYSTGVSEPPSTPHSGNAPLAKTDTIDVNDIYCLLWAYGQHIGCIDDGEKPDLAAHTHERKRPFDNSDDEADDKRKQPQRKKRRASM